MDCPIKARVARGRRLHLTIPLVAYAV